jgi:citrate lyase subunit beta / citryl-CoA lyase
MRARRSCLSVPGSSEAMLAKAATLPVDEVVIDLEDSVAPAAKRQARELVADLLGRDAIPAAAVAVRVNAIDSPWFADDVAEIAGRAGTRIGSLVVPKVEGAGDVDRVSALLDSLGEAASGVRIQALVETARGLLRAGEIADASPRLDTLILGYADLAASLGRPPGLDSPERWLHAQETLLVAARASGLQAIDGPYLGIRDGDGLRARAERVRALGFDGKWAVHPDQVEAINEVFTPAREEFERASAVVAALGRAEDDEARGAVELDGAMVDEASRKLALQIVARGRAAGLA